MASTTGPATRARYMKSFLEQVDGLGPDRAQAVRARVAPELLRKIEIAGPLAWLPLDTNTELTRAVMETLDAPDRAAFFQQLVLGSFETPLFRGFINATVRLLGLDPGKLVGVIGRVFEIMFRDAGRWSVVDRTQGGAILRVDDLAPGMRTTWWCESLQLSLTALHAFTNTQGKVQILAERMSTGTVDFQLSWSST